MTLISPAELLGLPPGFAGRGLALAGLRYALLALVAVWCWALAEGRRRTALTLGVACAVVSSGYWILALARPWGVLVDPDATLRAAELAVAAVAPEVGSFVAGEPASAPLGRFLLSLGVPGHVVLLLPSLAPLFVPVGLMLAVAGLWSDRDRAALAASLLLVVSTSELTMAAGWGLLSEAWSRPLAAAAVPVLVAASLALVRVPGRTGTLGAPLLLVVGSGAIPRGEGLPLLDGITALTLDQGLWLPLALLGVRAGLDTATRTLLGVGAGMTLLGGLGLPVEALTTLAVYRTGLVLAGTVGAWSLAPALVDALRGALPRLPERLEAHRLVGAGMLAVLAPGSVLVWWDPPRTDYTTARSVVPLSPALEPVMAWIRENTPSEAVFLASPAHSSTISVRTGRRVLRAQDAYRASDESERVRSERPLLMRRDRPERVRRYGVGWVYAAPGDFRSRGIDAPEALVGSPGLRLRYRDRHRIHVFEVVSGP